MVPEMSSLVKHDEELFMQDEARAHPAKLTLEILKDKKQLRLMEPHLATDYSRFESSRFWDLRTPRVTYLDSLK